MRKFFTAAPTCGTAACIAGWALALEARLRFQDRVYWEVLRQFGPDMFTPAQKRLGLTRVEASRLFLLRNQRGYRKKAGWPRKFDRAYTKALEEENYAGAARITAKRIDHFITTNGKE